MFGDRLKLAGRRLAIPCGAGERPGEKVSAQAIGKYERGEMMPSSDVLSALGKVLGVSLEYLLSEQVEALRARVPQTGEHRRRGRAQVEAEVIDSFSGTSPLKEILGLDSAEWKPACDNRFIGEEAEGEILAEILRKEWQLGVDPIPNMTSLLEDHGIKVLVMPLPDGVWGLTCLVRRPRQREPRAGDRREPEA